MAAKKKRPAVHGGATAAPNAAQPPRRRRDALLRNGVALLLAVLTVAAVARLFAFAAWVQLGLVVAGCAGLLATSLPWAAVVAAAAVLVGLPVVLGSFSVDIAAVALAAVGALAIRWLVGRKPGCADWVAFALIGLIVANMWATTLYVNLQSPPGGVSVAEQVAQSPPLDISWSDAEFYQRVLWNMRQGTNYYEAYRKAFNENIKWRMDPPSVISYRLPTAFWIWVFLPGGPIGLFVAWLAVSSAAIAAGVRIALRRASAVFAVPAAATLATYMVYFGTSDAVYFTEAWGAALGVVAVAAAIESFESSAWRGWTILAVVFGVLACLVRELMVFLPVAGILAALAAGGEQRRFRITAWTIGLAAFAGAYVSHAMAVGGAVSGRAANVALSSGGLQFLANAFTFAVDIVGGGAALLVLFAGMSAAGIWLDPNPGERWFLAAAAALPLAAFLLFGNDAVFASGTKTNYWGTVVVPLLIVLSPWAFAALPAPLLGSQPTGVAGRR